MVNKKHNGLEITTLGKFEVKRAGQVLSQDSSYRVWELFKYIITNRQNGIVPELALENLWPDQDYADPRGAVRALIFRLRKSLGKNASNSQDYIVFSQGCYHWNNSVDYWLDVEEFENKAQQAASIKETQPQQAESLLLQAIELYQGEYLPESYYCQWTIPVRNYYHTLYLQVVLDLMDLLTQRNDNPRIISVCEQALLAHPYEEDIHRHYLKALIKEGRVKQAQNHYAYTSQKFYQDLGIKPSPDLQKILQTASSREAEGLDLNGIQNHLQEESADQGAFVCDTQVFKEIYKLERRRGERLGISVFMALVSITDSKQKNQDTVDKSDMNALERFLVNSLRKGDVIARWSSNQYVLMLPGLAYEQGEKVMERIKNGFNRTNQYLTMTTEIQPVLPLEAYV
jgi:DNA-binding SARP family transcriptional activator